MTLQIRTSNNGIIKDFHVKLGQLSEGGSIPLSLPHRFGILGPIIPPTLGIPGSALSLASPFQDSNTPSSCNHVEGTTLSIC